MFNIQIISNASVGHTTNTCSDYIEHVVINSRLPASTHLDGHYYYNRAPMAPPGTIIIAHETPNTRRTWAPHGQDGWYIGPALDHYMCYTVYITKYRSDRIVETFEFFPTEVAMPFQSSKDLVNQADKHLTHALLHPQPAGPFNQVGDYQMLALERLSDIFEGALTTHKTDVTRPMPKSATVIHLRGCKRKQHL
jgi:hypothetical protein